MTKLELRNRTLSEVVNFMPTTRVPPQVVDQFVEYAVWAACREAILQNDGSRQKKVTLNAGDPLPADWGCFAYRAFYVVSGVRQPLHWLDIQLLGVALNSTYGMATAGAPAIYFVDQIVNTAPVGLTGITIYYYPHPPRLFGQPDNTDDGLSPVLSTYVWRGAAARVVEFFLDPMKAWSYSERMKVEQREGLRRFAVGVYANQVKDVRNVS